MMKRKRSALLYMDMFLPAEAHQVGNAVMPREDYDLIQIVLVCPDDESKAEKDSILRMLSVLLSEKLLEDEYAIPMTRSIRR